MGRALYSTIYTPASSPVSLSPSPSPPSYARNQNRAPMHSFPRSITVIEDYDTSDDSDPSRSSSPTSSIDTDNGNTELLSSLPSSIMVVGDQRVASENPVRATSPPVNPLLTIGSWDTHKFDPDSDEFWAGAEYEAVVENTEPTREANAHTAASMSLPPLDTRAPQHRRAPSNSDLAAPPSASSSAVGEPSTSTSSNASDAATDGNDFHVRGVTPSHAPRFPTPSAAGWTQVPGLGIWTREGERDGRAHVRAHASNPHASREQVRRWSTWVPEQSVRA